MNFEEFRVSTSMCSSEVQWGEPQRSAVPWPGSVGEEQTLTAKLAQWCREGALQNPKFLFYYVENVSFKVK